MIHIVLYWSVVGGNPLQEDHLLNGGHQILKVYNSIQEIFLQWGSYFFALSLNKVKMIWSYKRESLLQYLCDAFSDFAFQLACS